MRVYDLSIYCNQQLPYSCCYLRNLWVKLVHKMALLISIAQVAGYVVFLPTVVRSMDICGCLTTVLTIASINIDRCDARPTVSSGGLCGALPSSLAFGDCYSASGYCKSTEDYCSFGSRNSSYSTYQTVAASFPEIFSYISSVNVSCAGRHFGDCCP